MSLSLEMIQVARLARNQLGDSTSLVREFLQDQQSPDGAFCDKTGAPDLYYTVFGLDCCKALQIDVDVVPLSRWLSTHADALNELDFVHLSSLARCLAYLPPEDRHKSLVTDACRALQEYSLPGGGFRQTHDANEPSVYATFLATMALQDLGVVQEAETLAHVTFLRDAMKPDGGFANEATRGVATTPATAAAVTLLRGSGQAFSPASLHWLMSRLYPEGGFFATPSAPVPDLLSTAVALHALAGSALPLDQISDVCLDYVDTLWTTKGGFFGNWAEDHVDVEYTFYGLLALGHLDVVSGAVSE